MESRRHLLPLSAKIQPPSPRLEAGAQPAVCAASGRGRELPLCPLPACLAPAECPRNASAPRQPASGGPRRRRSPSGTQGSGSPRRSPVGRDAQARGVNRFPPCEGPEWPLALWELRPKGRRCSEHSFYLLTEMSTDGSAETNFCRNAAAQGGFVLRTRTEKS